jgi:hypothetical protein
MKTVHVSEEYQDGYSYPLVRKPGDDFSPDFQPELTPKQMLQLGVFGGDYFNQVPEEFPKNWFTGVEFTRKGSADASLNCFTVNASQPLAVWQKKGWIYEEDPKGWFLWYCRYYMGRRIATEDARQIKRWRAMRRHIAQLHKTCQPLDLECHPRQRQALLHWAYDSRKI